MSEPAQNTLHAGSAAELIDEIETSVMSGALAPGQRLPSVRSLAAEVGLSPVTVASALAELRRRGVVITERRRGSRIGQAPPIGARRAPLSVPPGVRDLSRGNPDPELLPDLARALARLPLPARLYGEPPVLPALAVLARERLRAEGVDAEHLCVLNGALDAIERVVAANLRAGDIVAVEDPGYVALYDLLRAAGMQLEPVPIDDRGMLPLGLSRALARGAAAVVITPRAQNPTGAATDSERARELRAVLESHPRALVVEDDHLGPLAAVALNSVVQGRERWAFTRSVAKALGPDLRLAVLTGDERTIARVQGRQQCGPGWVSHILQALVAELWSEPACERRSARAAEVYVQRRVRLLEELEACGIAARGASGLNVWIPVAEESSAVAGLLQRGFLVCAGAPYTLATGDPAVRVTAATLLEHEAAALAAALADVLAAEGASRSG
jgi:DNA-binding transcriptional MocR family regulator